MVLAREKQVNFEEFLKELKDLDIHLNIDMLVTTLTTTFWPTYKFMDLYLLMEMEKAIQVYEEYHKQTTKSWKLTWIYSMEF